MDDMHLLGGGVEDGEEVLPFTGVAVAWPAFG